METIRTPEKRIAFLSVLAETGIVGKALKGAGISRSAAYQWRDEEPEFAKDWDRALKVGVSALEDEAHRRGFEGFAEGCVRDDQGKPILDDDGKPIPLQTKYSDTLAIFLLKAHAPERYRERTEVKHAGHIALTALTDEEINAEIAALVAKAGESQGDDLV